MNNQLLLSFKSWLQKRQYNQNTIRNYLSDVNKFLLSNVNIENYLSQLLDTNGSSRQVSSLKKFIEFELDQKIISKNPIKKLLKPSHQPNQNTANYLLNQYKIFLFKHNKDELTIKNYLNDIRQYLSFFNIDLQNEPT